MPRNGTEPEFAYAVRKNDANISPVSANYFEAKAFLKAMSANDRIGAKIAKVTPAGDPL